MKAGMSIDYGDLNQKIVQMINRAEKAGKDVTKAGERIVKDVTDKLEEETINRMPVDEAMLEKSIESEVEVGSNVFEIVGRVWIPADAPAADYAMFMHEWTYNLGKRSQDKQDSLDGIVVGSKYMERAISENSRAFGLYIVKQLKELIGD